MVVPIANRYGERDDTDILLIPIPIGMEKGGEKFHIRNDQFGIENKGCVTLCGLAIYIKKSISRQKKNYENSNISPCKNTILTKKTLIKKPKSFKIS